MGLSELRLRNFRSFEFLDLALDPDAVTVFLSPNGTGKTSVLEAIFTLATAGSFRTTASLDLVRTNATEASVWGLTHTAGRRVELELQLRVGARSVTKRLLVNTKRPENYAAVYESFPVTVFTPEGVDMVRREPGGRRDFLTRLAVNLDPRVADVVERFERVLRQRNALLRSWSGEPPTSDQRAELSVWNREFVDVAEALVTARERALDPLLPRVSAAYERLAQHYDVLGLSYERSWTGSLDDALQAAERDDRHRGHTTIGPHRDDLAITLNGRDARRQASQGEQRSVALAMLLAGDQCVREERAIEPLLMLDDVFSELDPLRSARLLELLPPGQTLVTTAVPLPDALAQARVMDLSEARS